MATQQANIELLNCRMEVVRLQAYKEAKERIKACILNVHELLCSQIEMGMSMMNYVKDSISVLDKNDSWSYCQILHQVCLVKQQLIQMHLILSVEKNLQSLFNR
ncbi:unnamed protein product [Schistosoma mattheei]|uniref:Uncharacterized protein n=1 Tax=Schistosoma mattheei TaxID=31246 RepID=A0AA85ASX1_9TREM|nr:unnamed protein product [Schistosoma mattheei]